MHFLHVVVIWEPVKKGELAKFWQERITEARKKKNDRMKNIGPFIMKQLHLSDILICFVTTILIGN